MEHRLDVTVASADSSGMPVKQQPGTWRATEESWWKPWSSRALLLVESHGDCSEALTHEGEFMRSEGGPSPRRSYI